MNVLTFIKGHLTPTLLVFCLCTHEASARFKNYICCGSSDDSDDSDDETTMFLDEKKESKKVTSMPIRQEMSATTDDCKISKTISLPGCISYQELSQTLYELLDPIPMDLINIIIDYYAHFITGKCKKHFTMQWEEPFTVPLAAIHFTPLANNKLAFNLLYGPKDIQILDLANDKIINTLTHSDICELKFLISLENGNKLASAAQDGSIKFWDLTTRDCIKTLPQCHNGGFFYVTSLGNNRLAATSYDIEVLDLTKKPKDACVNTLKGHKHYIRPLLLLDKNHLASASWDKTIKIWDLRKKDKDTCIKTLEGHTAYVHCLTQLDKNTLISADEKGIIKIWDLRKKDKDACINSFQAHTDCVTFLVYLGDLKLISICRHERIIKVWDLANDKCINTIKGFEDSFWDAILLDNGYLADGGFDGTVRIWDLTKKSEEACVKTFQGRPGPISLFQNKNGYLMAASANGDIKIWS